MSKLRVFEAFSGVGTQSMALKRLGVDYEVVGIAEIDKFAIQSYTAIHGETKNYGDISKINPTELPDMDLFTYSFPCQDLSISGRQRGMSEGTRSGLLYECEKVITTKKPKYLLLENVKNLVSKKFKPDFDKWLEWLESQGYSNYWQVLNAKDYGVPQNRERVFVVSVLGEETYEFPSLQENVKIIKHDIPQEVTVRKYEVDIEKLKVVLSEAKKQSELTIRDIETMTGEKKTTVEHWFRKDNCFSIPSPEVWPQLKWILRIETNEFDESIMTFETRLGVYEKANRVYDVQGIAPTLTTGKGELILDYNFPEPFPLEVKLKDILEDEVDEKYYLNKLPSILTEHKEDAILRKERTEYGKQVRKKYEAGEFYDKRSNMTELKPRKDEISNTITTVQKDNLLYEVRVKEATKLGYKVAEEGDSINLEHPNSTTRRGRVGKQVAQTLTTSPQQATLINYRIRRLTPLECWRLMGIDDEDFYKAKNSGISDSQLYKQAGNAIVVDVLVGIFGNLFGQESYLSNTDEIDDLSDYTFVYANEVEQQQWRL